MTAQPVEAQNYMREILDRLVGIDAVLQSLGAAPAMPPDDGHSLGRMFRRALDGLAALDGSIAVLADGAGTGDGGDSGMVLLASGTISSPVASLDLALTEGYSDFELRLVGWQVDETGEDSLQYRFSLDGGATFSTTNAYMTRFLHSNEANLSPGVSANGNTNTSGKIADGYPSPVASAGVSMSSTIKLFPGSSSLYPKLEIFNNTVYSDVLNELTWESAVSVYAVVGRADAIRLLTIGQNIYGGIYWLYGRPTP